MLDLVSEAVAALQAETASYPQNVQVWMKLMGGSFLASLVFVPSRVGARWILAAILWAVWRSVEHFSFSREANSLLDWTYIVWLAWASLLMSISLFFDFRTLISMWI